MDLAIGDLKLEHKTELQTVRWGRQGCRLPGGVDHMVNLIMVLRLR